ncbi:M14 family zinc carboxypeptidase [Pedobacter sp. UC225_65]|uniref:M14 family zinc carboxypeptidase n=1 Tax=Pedobacter sp. UC225_65 TaxID=3350173 RepID=UPI00366D3778
MKKLLLLSLMAISMASFAQQTPFERSNKKETTTYAEAIAFYEGLAKAFPQQAKLFTYGSTDFGKPLHLLVLSKKGIFDPSALRKSNKRIFLVNNGIHPGEPEGIDASMMLSRDLLKGNKLPEDVVICIIPVYNIDGSHNRSGTSRANQNGPVAYGFRGNSKNYDLNRDFIKTDSKNSQAFQQIFNTWQPEIFVDTHTSNGADYQYTMTLIPTQKDKLNPILSSYLTKTMVPDLYSQMKGKGYELILMSTLSTKRQMLE